MDGRAISRLTLVIVGGWLLNLLVVLRFGADHELYPFTAWPMFAKASHRTVTIYKFQVEPRPGEPARELLARDMVTRGSIIDAETARSVLDDLDQALAANPGHTVPDDQIAIWFANAQQFLGLAAPPSAVSLIRYETATDRAPRDRLQLPAGTTVVRLLPPRAAPEPR